MNNLKPKNPPFRMGESIRYVGTSSFCYGDNPMVEPGDVGSVTENHEGSWGRPDLGEDLADPMHGWSIVEIKGNRMAVSADSKKRFVRA